MNVEFTARKCEITPNLRKSVETGLSKIRKILGDKFDGKVILAVEKHRHKAEITISPRNGPLVGIAQAGDMKSAIGQAIDHLEKQAVKYKTRWRSKKRHEQKIQQKKVNGKGAQDALPAAIGLEIEEESAEISLVVHKFPAVAKSTEVHLVRSDDAVAVRPMTLEEAIKEAHFRDRDVFVFRDPQGKVMVLHRTREGRMELIEAP
jgi:putative sigma-54 modulation protein